MRRRRSQVLSYYSNPLLLYFIPCHFGNVNLYLESCRCHDSPRLPRPVLHLHQSSFWGNLADIEEPLAHAEIPNMISDVCWCTESRDLSPHLISSDPITPFLRAPAPVTRLPRDQRCFFSRADSWQQVSANQRMKVGGNNT